MPFDDFQKLPGPERIQKSFARFLLWFEEYGNHLWTLALFPDWNKEEISHDFQEIIIILRKRFLQDPTLESYDALLFFWKEWNRRIAHKNKRKNAAQLAVPLMLFSFGWSLAKVSKITGWGLSHLRFVTLETLRNLQKNPLSPLSLSRDCLRSDLFVIEHMLGTGWNDAFQVFGPKQLSSHLEKCPRCSKQLVTLKESSILFKKVTLESVPQHLELHVSKLQLPQSKTEVIKFQYRLLGFFPKLILQSSVISLVLFIVLNMPFIGTMSFDQLRPLKEATQTAWQVTENSFNAAINMVKLWIPEKSTPVDAPPPAAVAVVETPQTPSTEALPTTPAVSIASAPAAIPAENKITAVDKPVKAAAPQKIFLRWGAFTTDLEGFTPRILEILARYQAEKAGDLELGAEYRGGRYFHFRMPEEHKELLKKEIQNLNMKNFYVDTAPSSRDEIPGKIRVVFLVRPPK